MNWSKLLKEQFCNIKKKQTVPQVIILCKSPIHKDTVEWKLANQEEAEGYTEALLH